MLPVGTLSIARLRLPVKPYLLRRPVSACAEAVVNHAISHLSVSDASRSFVLARPSLSEARSSRCRFIGDGWSLVLEIHCVRHS